MDTCMSRAQNCKQNNDNRVRAVTMSDKLFRSAVACNDVDCCKICRASDPSFCR